MDDVDGACKNFHYAAIQNSESHHPDSKSQIVGLDNALKLIVQGR